MPCTNIYHTALSASRCVCFDVRGPPWPSLSLSHGLYIYSCGLRLAYFTNLCTKRYLRDMDINMALPKVTFSLLIIIIIRDSETKTFIYVMVFSFQIESREKAMHGQYNYMSSF